MQLNSVKRDVTTSGTMEVSKAKIKASAKLFDMFADQTYANKPVAILRELVANGVDAHTAAGKSNVPVEIFMPSAFDPMFKVKDFGIGMPHDFVMGPFMEYTNGSTKDQSNDQIGGFGIGSKSPFAYCDQFTLRVVHDGVLSVYTMFKDEEGIPAIGLQGQTTTDEENGVEVSFPVEIEDVDSFTEAAQTALKYFQPLPIVHGGELKAPDYTHVGIDNKWAMSATPDGTLGVIMGGVRYPVTADSLSHSLRFDSKLSPLLNYGIDLFLPIGTCDVAMSREALSYTDRTTKGIKAALENILAEVISTFATLFDHHPTRWEAERALYQHLTGIAGSPNRYSFHNNPRAQMIKSHAKWKGNPLALEHNWEAPERWDYNKKQKIRQYPSPLYPKGAQIWQLEFSSWRVGFPPTKFVKLEDFHYRIAAGEISYVFIDDMEIKPKSRTAARVKEYLEKVAFNTTSNNKVLVFRAEKNQDKASIKFLLNWIGNPNVIYTSKLPEPQRKTAQVSASGSVIQRPKIRMFKFNGQDDTYGRKIINLSPAGAKSKAVTEIAEKDQPTSGIVVEMNNFALPENMHLKMQTGLVEWDDLVFVNQSDMANLSGFKKFDEVFDPLYKKLVRETKRTIAQKQFINNWIVENDSIVSGMLDLLHIITREKLSIPSNSTFAKLVKQLKLKGEITTADMAVSRLEKVVPVSPANFDVDLAKKFRSEQPEAFALFDALYVGVFKSNVNLVKAFVKCL